MSCFWDSIFSSLDDNDYKYLYFKIHDIKNNMESIDRSVLKDILIDIKRTNINDLIQLLMKYNRKCNNVQWNGEKLGEKLIEESFAHVNDFLKNNSSNNAGSSDINAIVTGGYLCGICDPFLILISELFDLGIEHGYLKEVMKYTLVKGGERRVLRFTSDQGHFKVG
jgi:hypothetical protein